MKNGMHFEGTARDLVRACNSENYPLLQDKLHFLVFNNQEHICSILINGRE
jgi:hypothetical protein